MVQGHLHDRSVTQVPVGERAQRRAAVRRLYRRIDAGFEAAGVTADLVPHAHQFALGQRATAGVRHVCSHRLVVAGIQVCEYRARAIREVCHRRCHHPCLTLGAESLERCLSAHAERGADLLPRDAIRARGGDRLLQSLTRTPDQLVGLTDHQDLIARARRRFSSASVDEGGEVGKRQAAGR